MVPQFNISTAVIAAWNGTTTHSDLRLIPIILNCSLPRIWLQRKHDFDGLVQDCSNCIANAQELLQSCTKQSMYAFIWHILRITHIVHTLLCCCNVALVNFTHIIQGYFNNLEGYG